MVLSCLSMRWWKMNGESSQCRSSVRLSHGITMTVAMWWVLWHVTLVRPLCDGQHPTAGRGGCRVPRPGRSGDTPADTRVDTEDMRNTCDLLNCKLCGHHFICSPWCFFLVGGAFCMKMILYLLLLTGSTSGDNLCRRVARESNCHQQRRGVTQHIRTFLVPSQDTGHWTRPGSSAVVCFIHNISVRLWRHHADIFLHSSSWASFLAICIKQKETKTEHEHCVLLWHHRDVPPLQ